MGVEACSSHMLSATGFELLCAVFVPKVRAVGSTGTSVVWGRLQFMMPRQWPQHGHLPRVFVWGWAQGVAGSLVLAVMCDAINIFLAVLCGCGANF